MLKQPGCLEYIHTLHLWFEELKFQHEKRSWCLEDLSRKKHK